MSDTRTFEDLKCYVLARSFRKSISSLCKTLPKGERRLLCDQMIRASRSVAANIAEGYGRHHHKENCQFCRQSRGSLSEMLEHLNVALDEGYLQKEVYEDLRKELESVWAVLNGYIAYLARCDRSGVPEVQADKV